MPLVVERRHANFNVSNVMFRLLVVVFLDSEFSELSCERYLMWAWHLADLFAAVA